MTLMKMKKKQRIQEIIKTMMSNDKMSLSEITSEVNLSLPKVTEIINELYKSNIVNESVFDDTPLLGRPSQKYNLNPSFGYFIGIDLGRITTNIVVLDYIQKKIYEKSFRNLIKP